MKKAGVIKNETTHKSSTFLDAKVAMLEVKTDNSCAERYRLKGQS